MEEAGYSWDAQIRFDYALVSYYNRFEQMRQEREEVELDPMERREKKKATKFVPKYDEEYLKEVLDGIKPLDADFIQTAQEEMVTKEMWDAIPEWGDEEG